MVERSLSFRVRRFLVLVLVVMLAFGPIHRAYADDFEGGGGASQSFVSSFGTVWYGPTASGYFVRYGVVANTRYDAAVYCCRGRSFDLDDLSPTKKSKLLSDRDFNSFAQLFNASKPETTSDWAGDANIIMAWNSARQLYGETYCWNARYTNAQKIWAQEAIEDVLNDDDTPSGGGGGSTGGPISGGGNVGTSGNYVFFDVDTQFGLTENDTPITTKYAGLAITLDYFNGLLTYLSEHNSYKLWIAIGGYANSGNSFFTITATNVEPTHSTGRWSEYQWGPSSTCVSMEQMSGSEISYGGKKYIKMPEYITFNASNVRQFGGITDACRPVNGYYWGGLSGSVSHPTEPPVQWPDPPTEDPEPPEPPEVPTPGDPIEPIPPDPVDPTPGNPWIPIPDEDITITGEDFQDLIDALNEHCIHLQNSIESNISQLWDLQSDFLGNQFEDLFGTISDNFTWLGNDVITESYNDLKSYLHELFEWLSEQLNFDVQVEGGQYDDTSVIYWLKQIWASLPTGINTRPTDPVTNPDGWWDWLTQLLNNLAADLMALGHDELAGVLETLNQLRSKFPFSLPWDVAALLGLLVGVPECPEFDMPCYTVSLEGLQQVGTYHVTLEPYETVWEGVKWIETLAFAVYLIMHTGGLMDMVTKTVRPR